MQSGWAVGHAEACRKRVVEELDTIGDERLQHEEERLFEQWSRRARRRRPR